MSTPSTRSAACAAGLAAGFVFIAAAGPASAGDDGRACYELIGCPHETVIHEQDLDSFSCDALYDVRNIIYLENGYCFATSKAIERFGNEGCSIRDASAVPLNKVEQRNIATIRAAERQRACK